MLADRGFGDQKLFNFLVELGFGYVLGPTLIGVRPAA
jgi:hypothetical protein